MAAWESCEICGSENKGPGCIRGECAYNRMKKMDKGSGEKGNKVM
jgi:hypothetical protein